MKKREPLKASTDASNSDDETKEETEDKENGDESAAPEKSKANDSQAENAEGVEENGTADKSIEETNDGDKETTAATVDEKKTTNGSKKPPIEKKNLPRRFIRLTCVHCRAKCVKFQVNFIDPTGGEQKLIVFLCVRQEYTNHLFSRKHKVEMRHLAVRQKTQIARMRTAQRKAQRELEESIPDIDEKSLHFCMVCRLNYRTPKDEHQESESHINLKKFLLPYCKICRISFKSPMVYETHRCSLEHIKVGTDQFTHTHTQF